MVRVTASCWISVLTTVCSQQTPRSGKRVDDQFCDCIIRPPGVCLEHSRKKGRRAQRVGWSPPGSKLEQVMVEYAGPKHVVRLHWVLLSPRQKAPDCKTYISHLQHSLESTLRKAGDSNWSKNLGVGGVWLGHNFKCPWGNCGISVGGSGFLFTQHTVGTVCCSPQMRIQPGNGRNLLNPTDTPSVNGKWPVFYIELLYSTWVENPCCIN